MTKLSRVFLPLLLLASFTVAIAGDDWPRWRGGNMDATGSGDFTIGAEHGLRVAWRKPLGSGYSSVSISDGRAVTMFSDSTNDIVVAFDAQSGTELWRYRIDATYKGHDGSHDGPISTPLLADGKLFALATQGHFFALDAATGKQLWRQHLVDDLKAIVPTYGFATSPVLHGDVLVLETGGEAGTISGFNPDTGERLWSVGQDTVSYQSPSTHTVQGAKQLLCVGNKHVYGLEPGSGKMLWDFKHDGGFGSMNPVPIGENRFFLQYKWRESIAFEIKKTDGSYTTAELWKNRSIRGSYNTPVYHDGYLYGYSARFLTCVDAATGESVWKSRAPGDGFTILVDGHLVVVTKQGGVHVAKATPDGYQEIASLKAFDGLAWAPPSFANGMIYTRSLKQIAAIDIAKVEQPLVADQRKMVLGREFAKFLHEANMAEDKQLVVDNFFAAQKVFPVIEGNIVHFVYRGKGDDVVLMGDMVGARQDQPMTRIEGTEVFYHAMQVTPAARLNYNYAVDFGRPSLDSLNTLGEPDMFGPASHLEMADFVRPKHLVEPTDGMSRGRLDSVQFESKIAGNSRKIDIYLPSGYESDSARRYPAIYVHMAGQALAMAKMQNSLDNLVGKSVAPLIGVFIHGVQGAGDEYQGDAKDSYSQMLAQELVPYIDQNYRTKATIENRANMGAAWAGFTSFYSTFKFPGVFGKVSSQSAGIWTKEVNELKASMTDVTTQPLEMYIDWGKYDLRSPLEGWDIGDESKRLAEHFKSKGYAPLGGESPTGFGWASWRTRTDKILEAFFPMNQSAASPREADSRSTNSGGN